jgi:hypothetical protein
MKVSVAAAVVLVAGVSGCLITPVVPIGGGKSSSQGQHERLDKLYPAQLTTQHKWRGEVRTAKLRVWADDEYRAQNMRWQHGFDEQLDYANQVLIPLLGVRLEADYQSWDHHAPGIPLAEHLDALAHKDPGEDVVFVVGLTSSLSLVSATFDDLGMAYLGERHLVMRGHADLHERKAFERAFPRVSAQERDAVLEARRRHKTTAVLVHELAHSLGALHETEAGRIMNPSYSHTAVSISDRNRELMLITLEDRLKPTSQRDPRATAQRLLAAVDVAWGGWEASDRERLVERLQGQLATMPAGAAAGPLPPTMQAEVRRAEQLLRSGRHADAAAVLEPLLAGYPAHADLRVLSCRIELARGGTKDARAIATCDRAAAMSAGVEPAMQVAGARAYLGDITGAHATLVAAEARIAGLAPDKAPAAWLTLATGYQQLGALTSAELAVAQAGTGTVAQEITGAVATLRMRYGIPRDGSRWKLERDNEPDALYAVRETLALIYSDKLDAAAKFASTAEKRWPALPGLLAARCDLAFRRGQFSAARDYCNRALAQGECSWARYLNGTLELQAGSRAATLAGIARLREVIKLDPDLAQAWRTLARALDRAKLRDELEQLAGQYEQRFHQRLF